MTHAGGDSSSDGGRSSGPGSSPARLHRPILDVGRRTRTIPPALRRALDARDRGCRFPGCGLRFTDAHHVVHWADGGETSLDNCLLLCRHHHRLVHEGGWRVSWWGEGRPVFVDPRGGTHYDGRWAPPGADDGGSHGACGDADGASGGADVACDGGPNREDRVGPAAPDPHPIPHPIPHPAPHAAPDLASALVASHRARGVDPDGWTLGATWEHGADIPDHVYLRAREAMDG